MPNLSNPEKERIINALNSRGAVKPCPRCGNNEFNLIDGYFNQSIQFELTGLSIGGPSIPSIIVVCSKCGYMSQHAMGSLGLLPQEKSKK